MALWPNKRLDGAGWNPYRLQGIPTTALPITDGGGRFNRYYGQTWSKLAGTPNGYYAGGSRILPLRAGALGGTSAQPITFTAYAVINEGRNIAGSTTINFVNANADLLLSALLEGTTTLTLTTNNPALGAAIGISGNAHVTLTNNTPILGALAGLFGNATVTLTDSGTLVATGSLSGSITPYTELSPENLARAVWSALASSFNEAGTMGRLLNATGGGSDPSTIAAAVVEALPPSVIVGKTVIPLK